MPTIDENKRLWDRDWSTRAKGERWSKAWGGSDMEWYGTILPRIQQFVPAENVLEIAPGFGRWTSFLKELCNHLVAVDLSKECIDACRERFASDAHVECHVNDGTSLAMIKDASIDFAFSFDSLVHAEDDVIAAYLHELARILKPNGVAFLHHSNAGRYRAYFERIGRLPRRIRRYLEKLHLADRSALRAMSVTAERFRTLADEAGIACISQETLNWRGRRRTDCFSVVARPESSWAGPLRRIENRRFPAETRRLRRLSRLYGALGRPHT